jgi:hypothetical protein
MRGKVIKIKADIDDSIASDLGGEPPMDSFFGQYLDVRFAKIEADVKEIRSDIKDQTRKINGLTYWFVATILVLATLFVTVVGYFTWTMQNQFNYHQSSMQAQMQAFSEYVKAVTKPQGPQIPNVPPPNR